MHSRHVRDETPTPMKSVASLWRHACLPGAPSIQHLAAGRVSSNATLRQASTRWVAPEVSVSVAAVGYYCCGLWHAGYEEMVARLFDLCHRAYVPLLPASFD